MGGSPSVQNGGHAVGGTWNPDMGIKFGAVGSPGAQGEQPPANKTWDPNRGFKFG
jgi:hypothetical protein